MLRECKKCKETKDLEEFTKNKNCKFGYEHTCRECSNRLIKKKHYYNNHEKIKAKRAKWRANNRERNKQHQAKYYSKPSTKKKQYEYTVQYRKDNPGWMASHCAKRRARKHKATPIWADPIKIYNAYKLAKKNNLVVDHIIPLKSKYVCGLHVETNLQLLTAQENSRKHNTFCPDTFEVNKSRELLETPNGTISSQDSNRSKVQRLGISRTPKRVEARDTER